MKLDQAILTILAAAPQHQIEGKKRLHKTIYLAQFAGERIPAKFHIQQFGVFSTEVAETLEFLSVFEYIETRDLQVGPTGYFATVFRNPRSSNYPISRRLRRIIGRIDRETTSILEVASTIAFFQSSGLSKKKAEQKTREMKPAISSITNIRGSHALLEDLRATSTQ